MPQKSTGIAHGSLIGLRKEAAGLYILLHRNVFPTVLQRIARSNLANYSIYHHEGILFGFYDYLGADFEKDMAEIAADRDTQYWWQLTEPLQEPLPSRKKGEWWAEMSNFRSFTNKNYSPDKIFRRAFRLKNFNDEEIVRKLLQELCLKVTRMEAFRLGDEMYVYLETSDDGVDAGRLLPDSGWSEMEEVFHTSGCLDLTRKKVFVTGCFDMLHSGHVAFLQEAASFGDLFAGIGSDANVHQLKGRYPVNNEKERKYMLESVRHVHRCMINKGRGIMDFTGELEEIEPDIFVVNEDGHTPEKEDLCLRLGIEYKVLRRIPHAGLPVRSTTALRSECRIPFRIDLAGGWLDQPFVSKYWPGPVLTVSIEPTLEFNDRSGMASSTRRRAIELWKTEIPPGDPEMLAKVLFSFDNPPGTADVSGSQDALGIVMPGLNRLDYDGGYWPVKITTVMDESILNWLEDHLFLVTLGPRTGDYSVVGNSLISRDGAKRLAGAAGKCWDAILAMDPVQFGTHFRESFEAQVAMFPNMAGENILRIIDRYRHIADGWKLSGAGGGGYLILVSRQPVADAIRIRIRRPD